METISGTSLLGVIKLCHVYFTCILLGAFLKSTAAGSLNQNQDVRPLAAGSTDNLKDIFLGRCYDHQQCLVTDRCIPNEPSSSSCSDLWDEFYGVFGYKESCNTLEDAYDSFLGQAKPYAPEDQTLFWSDLMESALNVARISQVYRILEETLPGYIVNSLRWCGDPNSQEGIDYRSCPDTAECDRGETMFTFWQAASKEFAKQARGRVSVALNAHRTGGAYKDDSVFATVELPNLIPSQVQVVEILLVPDVKLLDFKDIPEERCGEGTVLQLQQRIVGLGMEQECIYDPIEFNYIQCTTLTNPEDYKACSGGGTNSINMMFWLSVIVAITICLSR